MNTKIFWWVGIALLVAIAGGLMGWFLFINIERGAIQRVVEGRGFTAGEVTGGTGGSTQSNLVSFFGSALTGGALPHATATPEAVKAPRLWQVSPVPSAGFTSFIANDTTTELFRFIERPTGNAFQVLSTGGEPARITNTLIPRVYDAVWLSPTALVLRNPAENGVALRSFLAHIVKATSTTAIVDTLGGSYMDDSMRAVAANPSGREPSLLYLLSNGQGTFLIRAASDGSNPKRVWGSPLSNWRLSWLDDNTAFVVQKASEGVAGSAYTISLKSGTTSLVIGNQNGLTVAKHPSANALLYSNSTHGTTALYARVNNDVRKMPFATFAEKCVWRSDSLIAYCAVPKSMPNAELPDAWYRGEVSFTDSWYEINAFSGTSTPLFDPSSVNTALDVIDPHMDISGTHILFTDAKTETVWSLAL